MYSSSLKKGLVEGGRWSVSRSKSSKVDNVNKYINTWLGSDLKGERHTRNLVTGQQLPQTMQRGGPAATPTPMRTPVVVHPSRVTAPVVSVNWMASVTDIASAFNATEHKKAFLLDLSNAPSGITAEDIEKVVSIAAEAGSTVVAAVNTDGCAVAADTSLPLLMGMSQPMAPLPAPKAAAAASSAQTAEAAPIAATSAVPSLVYTGTVRSGQQLYAEGTSLVVIGSVNNGAELLADGDIHVYGKLAGRAIAGLSGDESARVFARTFQPSLVGIANGFATIDDLESSPAFGKFVSVGLKEAGVTLGKSEFGIECDDEQQLVLSVMD